MVTRAVSSVLITSAEGDTGKSAVALGVLVQLTRRVERVGVFRPVVRGGAPDRVLDLLLAHASVTLDADTCTGVTYDDVHADPESALGTVLERYHRVAAQCDAVVVVGSDYTDITSPTEFAFNAQVAANLGSPVLLVVSGVSRAPAAIARTVEAVRAELETRHGTLAAVVANRVDPSALEAVRSALAAATGPDVPVAALPEEPLLVAPTVTQLLAAVDGTLVSGDPALLDRQGLGTVVAAMTLPNVLDRLYDGAVVVSPGDRGDVLLGVLAAHSAMTFPTLSAVILNGGFDLPPQVSRLVTDLAPGLPLIQTGLGTFDTVTALSAARGQLSRDSERTIETALAMVERHLDGDALLDRLNVSTSPAVTPLMFEHRLIDRARATRRRIVLPEADDERILRAAEILLRRDVADIVLLGDPTEVAALAARVGARIGAADVVDPHTSPLRETFAAAYAQRRAHRGVTLEAARDAVVDASAFGTMMVLLGQADGMVSGARHTTAHTIRPAFEVIRTRADVSVVSSVFLMCLPDRVLVYGDCAVNPDPTAEQLADIAISSADTAAQFDVDPRIAMLSYSTGSSGSGADVDKVRRATALVRDRRPDLSVEGPIQYDAAVDVAVAQTKLPSSDVAGRATVFVFPDLNTGNNTYKAVQRSAGAVAIGPVLQGLRAPVNDLSRGATVQDIVDTVAITAIQAADTDPALVAERDATEVDR